MQSNWRFYGLITEPAADPRPGVLFVRTVTTSLVLAAFGRRLARCFPLHRARLMCLNLKPDEVTGSIDPGTGSAPALYFAAQRAQQPRLSGAFSRRFSSYDDYARWIIDQHLSLVLWPGEYVVQDMHLEFCEARVIPLTCTTTAITGFSDFMTDQIQLIDGFAVEVFLDNVYAAKRPRP